MADMLYLKGIEVEMKVELTLKDNVLSGYGHSVGVSRHDYDEEMPPYTVIFLDECFVLECGITIFDLAVDHDGDWYIHYHDTAGVVAAELTGKMFQAKYRPCDKVGYTISFEVEDEKLLHACV